MVWFESLLLIVHPDKGDFVGQSKFDIDSGDSIHSSSYGNISESMAAVLYSLLVAPNPKPRNLYFCELF